MQIQRCCQRSALMPSLIVLATSPGPSHILFQILVSQLCLLHHVLLIGSKEAVTLLLIQQQSSYQILCYLVFSIRVIFHLVQLLFVWKMPTIVFPRFDFMYGGLLKKKRKKEEEESFWLLLYSLVLILCMADYKKNKEFQKQPFTNNSTSISKAKQLFQLHLKTESALQ